MDAAPGPWLAAQCQPTRPEPAQAVDDLLLRTWPMPLETPCLIVPYVSQYLCPHFHLVTGCFVVSLSMAVEIVSSVPTPVAGALS